MTAPTVRHRGWTPPGYYVSSSADGAGSCAHCGTAHGDHQGPELFCPAAPREVCA
jgi:hypothetical protein